MALSAVTQHGFTIIIYEYIPVCCRCYWHLTIQPPLCARTCARVRVFKLVLWWFLIFAISFSLMLLSFHKRFLPITKFDSNNFSVFLFRFWAQTKEKLSANDEYRRYMMWIGKKKIHSLSVCSNNTCVYRIRFECVCVCFGLQWHCYWLLCHWPIVAILFLRSSPFRLFPNTREIRIQRVFIYI